MSELGDLLELLHGARGRYRTVRGVLRHIWRLRLAAQARERWEEAMQQAGHSQGTAYAQFAVDGLPAQQPDRQEQVIRFWSEPPDRLREETESLAPDRQTHVIVRDGRSWWIYSPELGAISNVGAGEEAERMGVGGGELWAALLDPARWLPTLDFEPGAEVTRLGRRALRVRATPRRPPADDPFSFPGALPVGADAYELLVDRALGVVVRAAALIEDEEFWVADLEQLAFDEEFPPETFIFEPPPGEEIRGPDIGVHEPVTIEEAARRASFPVFYLPEMPEGRWDLHVRYAPARDRPPVKESVHLAYHRVDATHHLMVTQRGAEGREPDWVAYGPSGLHADEVERDGVSYTLYRSERAAMGLRSRSSSSVTGPRFCSARRA